MAQQRHNALKTIAFALCLTFLTLLPLRGHAGTFCLKIPSAQPECFYDDAGECNRRALQLNGQCSVNPDKMTITATNGQFCMVTSGGAIICAYTDRGSCEKEAKKQNGACVDSTTHGAQPDLHRDMPGRLY